MRTTLLGPVHSFMITVKAIFKSLPQKQVGDFAVLSGDDDELLPDEFLLGTMSHPKVGCWCLLWYCANCFAHETPMCNIHTCTSGEKYILSRQHSGENSSLFFIQLTSYRERKHRPLAGISLTLKPQCNCQNYEKKMQADLTNI